jgi:hypothetical protein
MKRSIRLSADDLEVGEQNALDLFYSGIKSKETRRTFERNLKTFLIEACADIFEGDLNIRAQQFVNLAKKDQTKATQIILAYIRKLRERTELPKSNPDYLNPSTVPNRIKPIKKLLEMNSLGLSWKRIYATYPEADNTCQGRGYTLDEIRELVNHSDSIVTDFIILASSSGGLRVGAWDNLTWDCFFPIYKIGSEYKIELDKNEEGTIVCGAMQVYRGTAEEYFALISIEAWEKLMIIRQQWIQKMKKSPQGSDPVILERFSDPKPLTSVAVRRRIENLLTKSQMRAPLTEGKRRYIVPTTHGFRRFWDKVMMNSQKKRGTLAALAIKERLMGHDGIVRTDKNYFFTDILDSVPDYLDAMPELMISEEARLKKKLEDEKLTSQNLLKLNKEKDDALLIVRELEAKINRMTRYQRVD